MSPEIRVVLAPARAYALYAPAHIRSGPWIAIRRPLFVALIQGVAISMIATRTVAAPVVISLTICWMAVVLIQVVAALIVIGSSSRRGVPRSRAIDLFFVGHAPWSLWILAVAAVFTWLTHVSLTLVLLSALAPAALTARTIRAFAESVLGAPRSEAIRRTVLHQSFIWTVAIVLIGAAVALWQRVLALVA